MQLNEGAKFHHYVVALLAVLGMAVLFSLTEHKPVDVEGLSIDATTLLIMGG